MPHCKFSSIQRYVQLPLRIHFMHIYELYSAYTCEHTFLNVLAQKHNCILDNPYYRTVFWSELFSLLYYPLYYPYYYPYLHSKFSGTNNLFKSMWIKSTLLSLKNMQWPSWLQPYVEVLLLWISWAIDYVDWDYLEVHLCYLICLFAKILSFL